MIAAAVRRGLVAGFCAGVLAGLVGLVAGEPSVDAAVALEEPGPPGPPGEAEVTRPQQKMGLVVGTGLAGAAAGAIFGVAAAWAVGRVRGDAWARSLKLGATLLLAVVVLPALTYPANPPAVGDPETIGTRTTVYLGTVVLGLILAALAWAAGRRLADAGLSAPVGQTVVALGVMAAAALLTAFLPVVDEPPSIPAELLWSFRLGSLAVQTTLIGGTATIFGLLAARSEDSGAGVERVRATAPA